MALSQSTRFSALVAASISQHLASHGARRDQDASSVKECKWESFDLNSVAGPPELMDIFKAKHAAFRGTLYAEHTTPGTLAELAKIEPALSDFVLGMFHCAKNSHDGVGPNKINQLLNTLNMAEVLIVAAAVWNISNVPAGEELSDSLASALADLQLTCSADVGSKRKRTLDDEEEPADKGPKIEPGPEGSADSDEAAPEGDDVEKAPVDDDAQLDSTA